MRRCLHACYQCSQAEHSAVGPLLQQYFFCMSTLHEGKLLCSVSNQTAAVVFELTVIGKLGWGGYTGSHMHCVSYWSQGSAMLAAQKPDMYAAGSAADICID